MREYVDSTAAHSHMPPPEVTGNAGAGRCVQPEAGTTDRKVHVIDTSGNRNRTTIVISSSEAERAKNFATKHGIINIQTPPTVRHIIWTQPG